MPPFGFIVAQKFTFFLPYSFFPASFPLFDNILVNMLTFKMTKPPSGGFVDRRYLVVCYDMGTTLVA